MRSNDQESYSLKGTITHSFFTYVHPTNRKNHIMEIFQDNIVIKEQDQFQKSCRNYFVSLLVRKLTNVEKID